MSVSPIRLSSAAKYYEEESHQLAAWNWLQEQLTEAELQEFAELYRAAPASKPSNPLLVPYFSQRDNASGQGSRECFSSSCAMVAAYYGKVKGDDEYNVIRARFGDTTNADAQVKALQSLGLKASFRQNLAIDDLKREIQSGRPVAVGWLHHSSYQSPSGGGHWSVAVGFTKDKIIMHDPFGQADLIKGGYVSSQGGKYAAFANSHWLSRWEIQGGDGWGMIVKAS